MRVMGFSKKWDKLSEPLFSTFRLPRKDTDWHVDEVVQIVFKPRTKEREILFTGTIINMVTMEFYQVTEIEAVRDGFESVADMRSWLEKAHGRFDPSTIFNKITVARR